jgi:hypothetical protein
MSTPSGDRLEIIEREGYLEARHLGTYEASSYKVLMERSVQACKERTIPLLLVDLTDLAGFFPSTVDRYEMGALGARLAADLAKVAIVGTREQIERKFSTLVARNRGLNIDAFTDREEAVRWLLDPKQRA